MSLVQNRTTTKTISPFESGVLEYNRIPSGVVRAGLSSHPMKRGVRPQSNTPEGVLSGGALERFTVPPTWLLYALQEAAGLCPRGTAQEEEACGLSLDGPPVAALTCQGSAGTRTSNSFNKTSRCFANRRSAKQPVFLKQCENLAYEPLTSRAFGSFFNCFYLHDFTSRSRRA